MDVIAGSTDVTTYFVLRFADDGAEAVGLDPTTFTLTYTRTRAEPSAPAVATALADQDSDHTNNAVIEVTAAGAPGLYRVDWPDAPFATGVREVMLSVVVPLCFVEHLRVNLSPVPAALDATGLDSISVADPGALPDTFPQALVRVYRRFFKEVEHDTGAGTIKTYADNGSTVNTTQTVTTADGVTTVGAAT